MNIAFEPFRFSSDESRWQAVVRARPARRRRFLLRRAHHRRVLPAVVRVAGAAPGKRRVLPDDQREPKPPAIAPCKRCQPTSLPRELAIVERACKVLDADPQQRLTLAQLSDAVHVSPFHLQRLFTRVVGVSPRQYQAARRAEALRDGLQRGENVTRATHDAGFGSVSRMYDAAPAELGMTPSVYRRKGRRAYRALRHRRRRRSAPCWSRRPTRASARSRSATIPRALDGELAAELSEAERIEDRGRVEPFIAQIRAYLRRHARAVRPAARHRRDRVPAARVGRAAAHPVRRDAQLHRHRRRARRAARRAGRGERVRVESGGARDSVSSRRA